MGIINPRLFFSYQNSYVGQKMQDLTFGQAMLQQILPPGYYKPGDVLDKKGIARLMVRIANEQPERYEELSHKLVKLGLRSGESLGGASFGLKDLETPEVMKVEQQRLNAKIKAVLDLMPPGPERKAKIQAIINKEAIDRPAKMQAYLDSSDNRFGLQLKGAGRGNVKTVMSMLAGPVAAYNSNGDVIPVPVNRGYSQGQSFAQYLASSYTARRDINTTKLSVGASGWLSKLLQQASHRAVVVGDDDPHPVGNDRGIYIDLEDPDNIGAVLARDYGPYKRNTVITPKVMAGLKDRVKDGKVLLRSPIASSSIDSGVYALDVGVRENGRLPYRGEHVGLPSSHAIGEKLTQAMLGAKHGSSTTKQQQTPGLAGFELAERLVSPPQEGAGLAVAANATGRVVSIRKASQGGIFFKVAGQDEEQYVGPDFKFVHKIGDYVEAGDPVTDGMPDPAEAARYKGLGVGRMMLVNSMRRGLKEAGFHVDRRNIELLSRGLMDRVEFEDEYEDYLPGSVVPYSRLEAMWRARKGAAEADVREAEGKFLELPALHHTIGTRITPSIRKELESAGVKKVTIHADPPPFRPKVVRASDILQTDPDFMTRFLGSSLEKSMLNSIHQSETSDEASTSFVPVRASGITLTKSLFSGRLDNNR